MPCSCRHWNKFSLTRGGLGAWYFCHIKFFLVCSFKILPNLSHLRFLKRNFFISCYFFLFFLFFLEAGGGEFFLAPLWLKFLRSIREAAECRSLICLRAHLLPDATPPGIVVKIRSRSTYLTACSSFSILFKP